jgi:hypothetical protein
MMGYGMAMLSEQEKRQFIRIFSDLEILFNKQSIDVADMDDLVASLQSEEAKSCLTSLGEAQPEQALSIERLT